jgi:hypothetical protein
MNHRFALRAIILAAIVFQVQTAYPCSWAIGYFYQVTCLRGTVVGMNRGWPRWLRQRVARDNVNLRLYKYRWPLHDRSEMPLVKTVKTDGSGRFDFGELQEEHYTLVIDWPLEYGGWFDVEINKLSKPLRRRLMFHPYTRTAQVVTSSFRFRNSVAFHRNCCKITIRFKTPDWQLKACKRLISSTMI